jgi:hypothetical protein
MNDFINRFRTTSQPFECTKGIDLIDLSTLAPPRPANDLLHFCSLTSDIIGQALHFVGGTYVESQGAELRSEWCFWAPLFTPSGEPAELVIRAEFRLQSWWYRLCFHGGIDLQETLSQCILHSDMFTVEGIADQQLHVGMSTTFEIDSDKANVPVMRFELITAPHRSYSLDLFTRAQFGL